MGRAKGLWPGLVFWGAGFACLPFQAFLVFGAVHPTGLRLVPGPFGLVLAFCRAGPRWPRLWDGTPWRTQAYLRTAAARSTQLCGLRLLERATPCDCARPVGGDL